MIKSQNNVLKEKVSHLAPAVVLGVDMSGLTVIRSLGRMSVDVYVVGNNNKDFGSLSRYAEFVYCSNLNDEENVINTLLHLSKKLEKKAVLICTSDLHVFHVSKNRDLLKDFYFFILPDHSVVEMLMDKKKFYDFGSSNGFPLPKTYFSKSYNDLEGISKKISYPCVVKPLYRTKFWSENVPIDKKVIKIDLGGDIINELKQLSATNQPLIIQEWIAGDDDHIYFCLAYLNRESLPLGVFVGRKLRCHPSRTGFTSLGISLKHDELKKTTIKILKNSKCKGLCSVEYKYDTLKNEYKIIEPTVGRVDLQEAASVNAGLNLPYLAYKDALNKDFFFNNDYKRDVLFINEVHECNALFDGLKKNKNVLKHFFYSYKGKRSYALFAIDDMAPFFLFLKRISNRIFRYIIKSIKKIIIKRKLVSGTNTHLK